MSASLLAPIAALLYLTATGIHLMHIFQQRQGLSRGVAVMGGIAMGLEQKSAGNTYQQDWEFYAVTLCLFVIFALPGFIYHVELKTRLTRARRHSGSL